MRRYGIYRLGAALGPPRVYSVLPHKPVVNGFVAWHCHVEQCVTIRLSAWVSRAWEPAESSEESKKMESVLAIFSNIQTFNFSTFGCLASLSKRDAKAGNHISIYHPKYYGRSLPLLQEQGSLWHRCPQLYEHSRFYLSWSYINNNYWLKC